MRFQRDARIPVKAWSLSCEQFVAGYNVNRERWLFWIGNNSEKFFCFLIDTASDESICFYLPLPRMQTFQLASSPERYVPLVISVSDGGTHSSRHSYRSSLHFSVSIRYIFPTGWPEFRALALFYSLPAPWNSYIFVKMRGTEDCISSDR